MTQRFCLGSLVSLKDKAMARFEGLSMMGPFSVIEIIPRKDYPEFILKMLESVPDDKASEFSYRLADKEGNPVQVKSLANGEPADYIFGESLLVETASN